MYITYYGYTQEHATTCGITWIAKTWDGRTIRTADEAVANNWRKWGLTVTISK